MSSFPASVGGIEAETKPEVVGRSENGLDVDVESTTVTDDVTTTSSLQNCDTSNVDDILSLDLSERVELEEIDEENDAKLFWDVVRSMQRWQEHKEQQAELKKLGGLTR